MTTSFQYPERKDDFEAVKVDYAGYVKAYLQDRADPAAHLIGRIPDQRDSEGNFKTGDQIIREQRKIGLERISKDNNVLEIDVLKSKSKAKKK